MDLTRIHMEKVVDICTSFIRGVVDEAGANVAVVGLSGGIDSSVVAALAVRALGRDRVVGVIMPDTRTTPEDDVKDAKDLASALGIRTLELRIDDAVDSVAKLVPDPSPRALGNLRARVRMATLYLAANHLGGVVLGTGDKSEWLLGYFTKYGDGAADAYPILGLYKTQVRALGRRLGVPERIAVKPSGPKLFSKEHYAYVELGADYDVIDPVLYVIFEMGVREPAKAAELTGASESLVRRVIEMHESSRHKRATPPALMVDQREILL